MEVGLERRAQPSWTARPQAGDGSGREHVSWHSDRAKNRGCAGARTALRKRGKVSLTPFYDGGGGPHMSIKTIGEGAVKIDGLTVRPETGQQSLFLYRQFASS